MPRARTCDAATYCYVRLDIDFDRLDATYILYGDVEASEQQVVRGRCGSRRGVARLVAVG